MHGTTGIAIRSDLSRGLWEREESDSKAEKLTSAFPLMMSRGSMRNDGNAYIPFMAFALSQRPDGHALDVDGEQDGSASHRQEAASLSNCLNGDFYALW